MARVPEIPEHERTPLVVELLEIIASQQEQIQQLKDEIARLKGQKPRPQIKPSQMEPGSTDRQAKKKKKRKRPGSRKRKKTRQLEIHRIEVVEPEEIPQGSRFKGYDEYTVQDLVIEPVNTLYRLARWRTPQGKTLTGKLPPEVNDHFGLTLQSFVIYQYYHAQVTQPLILEMLCEMGIDVSAGKVNQIITEGKELFEKEKEKILSAGLEVSRHVHVDDTGARHQGRNGYCTHIGNESFAWFQSTESKSRINFLKLLRAGRNDYVINDEALDYMQLQKLPKAILNQLKARAGRGFENERAWKKHLDTLKIKSDRHLRIATEGALVGSILEYGFNRDLAIVSDDAGQFNVFIHGLCWIHAERSVNKLVGFNDDQRKALEKKRGEIWLFYDDLKKYKKAPGQTKKKKLNARFDEIFTEKTCFVTLNKTLKRIHNNKPELLLVLERPDLPLHNNESERDIREYVKRRKLSGSTRSHLGRRCRDTFVSLKKTCRKLGIPFWQYLNDRLSAKNAIPPLPDLIRLHARQATR